MKGVTTTKATITAEGLKCPKCHKPRMAEGFYPDDSIKHDCKCGYLMVWKPSQYKTRRFEGEKDMKGADTGAVPGVN